RLAATHAAHSAAAAAHATATAHPAAATAHSTTAATAATPAAAAAAVVGAAGIVTAGVLALHRASLLLQLPLPGRLRAFVGRRLGRPQGAISTHEDQARDRRHVQCPCQASHEPSPSHSIRQADSLASICSG